MAVVQAPSGGKAQEIDAVTRYIRGIRSTSPSGLPMSLRWRVSTKLTARTREEALTEVERIRKAGDWASVERQGYRATDGYEVQFLTRAKIQQHLDEAKRSKSPENFATDQQVRSFIQRYRHKSVACLPPYIRHRVKSKYLDGPKGVVEAEAARVRKAGGWAIVQESMGMTVTGYPDPWGWEVAYLDKTTLHKYIQAKSSKKA
jgi:hypothetical protein